MPAGTTAAVLAIIGAVIAATGTITSSAISSADADRARTEGRRLAKIKREDELNFNKANDRLQRLGLAQRRREARMQSQESRATRKQREEEFEFTKQQTGLQTTLGIINGNQAMRQNFASLFNRRAA